MTDKKPPPKCDFNFSLVEPPQENIESEIIDDESGEENPNFIYNEEPEADREIVVKETIVEKDIFDGIPAKVEEPKAEVKKQKKPRKPMTEEHKAKLGLAREKAMASRKANAIERKKMKDLETEEKELIKTQKIKRVKKLKAEVLSDGEEESVKIVKPPPPAAPSGAIDIPKTKTHFSKKDLEDAQLDAIMKYEAIRKQRKAEKKEKEMVDAEKNKMLNTIQRATGNTYRYRDGSNRWDGCY
tara:strand:+ start:3167 stop:3892 length:726 start_codon:yes stop_codon:yes gene_type:complete